MFWFLTLKVLFPGFSSHSGRILPRVQPGKCFLLLKIYLLRKIWPISVNRWKPVWIRAYYVWTKPESCLCRLENLSGTVWTPGIGTDLEHVNYTHKTLNRCSLPRGFGALNPNPHSWIFISISVGTQSRSYCLIPLLCQYLGLFTLRQKVAETHPIYDAPLSRSARRVTEVPPKSLFLSLVFTSTWA